MFQTTNQKLTCPWLVFIWLCPRVVVLHPNVRQMIKNHWTLWPFWGISHIWCKVLPQHRGARSEDYHRLSDWEAKAHASQGLDGFRRCILCAYLKIPEPSEDPRHKTFCSQCRRSAAHNRPQLLHMDVHPLGLAWGHHPQHWEKTDSRQRAPKKCPPYQIPPICRVMFHPSRLPGQSSRAERKDGSGMAWSQTHRPSGNFLTLCSGKSANHRSTLW